jgi:hypothetical protein
MERRIKMKAPKEKPKVKLSGEDGNAFVILGRVIRALRKAGADKEYIDKYRKEATSGNYDNLLCITIEYVDVL